MSQKNQTDFFAQIDDLEKKKSALTSELIRNEQKLMDCEQELSMIKALNADKFNSFDTIVNEVK